MSASSAFRPRRFLFVLALAIAAVPPASADDTSELSQRLIALRGEVETLNGELELLREEQRTSLQGLAAQKAELESNLKRQQVAQQEARDKVARLEADRATAGAAGDALTPVLLSAIEGLRSYIANALPFKTAERLAALDEIASQLQSGQLPSYRAANRLWAFYEDEFRITRETGLHQQTIRIGNEQLLADVAKVGSVMLLFKTDDDRMGSARRGPGGWSFEVATDEAERARIGALFDSLGKQIRQGYFELPAALAVSGG